MTKMNAADNDKRVSALHQDYIRGDVDVDLGPDGFFFHEAPPRRTTPTLPSQPRYSPPSKRSTLDKWAALGERRRAVGITLATGKAPDERKSVRRQNSFGNNTPHVAPHFGAAGGMGFINLEQNNHNHRWNRDKGKERPWNKGRDWNWRRERPIHLGDVEWVGAWQEAHS
jgi:hypothetical protein